MKNRDAERRMIEARKQLERQRMAEEAVKEERGFLLKHLNAILKDPIKVKSLD